MKQVNIAAGSPFVLLLGYSTSLKGGVSKATALLIANMPEITLHPVLFSYSSIMMSAWQTGASLIAYCFKLFVKSRRYRVIHILVCSRGDAVRVIPFILIAKIARKKICIQFHTSTDAILNGFNSRRARSLIRYSWNSVDLLCFLSDSLKNSFVNSCHSNTRMMVVPNLIDMLWLDSGSLSYEDRHRDIVYLGRWSLEKGVFDLISVMEDMATNVSCELYTDAPANIERRNCVFRVWIEEDKVLDVIRSAKLLVLPSYIEAYPTVLLEACACGTPFIATNVGGIPDIISKSHAGVLIEPGNKDEMHASISEMLENTDHWESCSRAGREWISGLSNEEIIATWRAIYHEMIA